MAVDMKQFELERLVNMLKAFNWEMQSSQFQDDAVIVTLKKVVKVEK